METVIRAELALDARAQLGEGATWDAAAGVLWWVDIEGQRLHAFDPRDAGDRQWPIGQKVSFVQPRARGGLVLGLGEGFGFFDPQTRRLEVFARPEADRPQNRSNDGRCDPQGRLWAGTMAPRNAPGTAALYRVDADLSVRRVLDATISNGLAWSADGRTVYYIDTPTQRIDAIAFDLAAGTLGERRPAVVVDERVGHPDGMTIDDEGMLWVAHWGGHAVGRWNPADGRLLARVELPVARVSSCSFGGANLDELYVTTAWNGLTAPQRAEQPLAGGLFVCRPGVHGRPAVPFAG